VVGGPIVPDEAGAVHREHHVELLQADVVDDLVIGALQERRVDRRDGLAALQGQAGGEQDRLLLCDADVEVAVGQLALEDVEPGAGVHRGGDPDHTVVALGLGHQCLAEHLRVGRRRRLGSGGATGRARRGRGRGAVGDGLGLGGVPLLHALQAALLGGSEALALDGGAVHHHRALGGQSLAQGAAQGADIVTVDDAHVGEVQLLPPQARGPERLDRLLEVRSQALEGVPDARRQLREAALDALPRVPQLGVEADAVEVARHRADVGRDRHPVVVEHHDDRGALPAGLVHRLEGDPAGQRTITGDGHDVPVGSVAPAHGLLDADGVADRGGGVPRPHDVVL
jgi:hypothetical protein